MVGEGGRWIGPGEQAGKKQPNADKPDHTRETCRNADQIVVERKDHARKWEKPRKDEEIEKLKEKAKRASQVT